MLDAYFARIGHHPDRSATLGTLQAIVARHTAVIPFENVDSFLGRPVRLDSGSLTAKLIDAGRGGYCFEQNLLLRQVLTTLGYRVTGLAARVRWNVPADVITPRGHKLLRVDLPDEGPCIVDVGFGGLTLTGVLRLVLDEEQTTPHEPFRLRPTRDDPAVLAMEAKLPSAPEMWKPLYEFDLRPQQLIDYEVSNHWVSTHPASPFTSNLMAARTDPRRRFTLRNNELAIHDVDGPSRRQTLATPQDVTDSLTEQFHLHLTPADKDALQVRLAQIWPR